MTKNKKAFNLVLAVALALMLALVFLAQGGAVLRAVAEAQRYSNVLDDLKRDKNFRAEDYAIEPDNYGLEVLQLAEGEEGELYVYVYSPSTTRARSINISKGKNLSPRNYYLKFLNESGALSKYLCLDFELEDKETRIYEVVSIFRPFIVDVDKKPADGNAVTEVALNVGKRFSATTDKNGNIAYDCEEFGTIEVTEKYVGRIRYPEGVSWLGLEAYSCDSHFVAFDTDIPIDELYEAELYFTYLQIDLPPGGGTGQVSDEGYKNITVNYTQTTATNPDSFHKKYKWNRIVSAEDFAIDPETDLKDDVKTEVLKNKWVLRFWETEYTKVDLLNWDEKFYVVDNLTILRLKFETAGTAYNLGVVDNKQSGSAEPSNKQNYLAYYLLGLGVASALAGVLIIVVKTKKV